MQLDIINKNYASFVTLPPPPESKERVFSNDEIARVLSMTNDPKHGEIARIVICLIETGCRIGELLAIKKADVNLTERYMVGGSKTDAGKNRVIPISKTIFPFVEEWMQTDGDLLLNSKKGNLKYRNVRYHFDNLMDKCGIEDVTPHTCRHTAATRMVLAGIDPAKVKKILGHASYATTIDIYTHMDASALVEAIDTLTIN
jgi:integrase